jgi:hypothetical protein
MELHDLLQKVVQAFDSAGIAYFVTGAIASMYYGEPRFTNDIDLVADMRPAQVAAFMAHFPPEDYHLSEEALREAIRRRGQFNIVHPASGLKVDVSIRSDDAFDASRFMRAQLVEPMPGVKVRISSPEDVILKKLAFYRGGGSEKHLRDITGVLLISGAQIDRDYVKEWAGRLGLRELWEAVQQRLEQPGEQKG